MALNAITFNKGKGGLGRPLPGEDHYSGLVFYSATLPAGFGTSDRIKVVYSVAEAEALGIAKGSSTFGVFHYHISEYFRINPKGVLYISINAVPGGSYDFTEVKTLQYFANGKLRQAGVFVTSVAYATSQVTTLQGIYTALLAEKMPVQLFYQADISATTDITTLADLASLTAENVTVLIGQDGAGEGSNLYVSTAKTVGIIGATLGAVSYARVHESIAWVAKFNMAAVELDTLAFGNGQLYRALTSGQIGGLHDKHYLFLLKHSSYSGSFFNDSWTACPNTSDYCTIENGRTIDKLIRGVYANTLPFLNAPLYVNDDGTLSEDTIKYIESLANKTPEQMAKDGELSGVAVVIDPTQDVLGTSKVVMAINGLPVGVARNLEVNVGYVKTL